MVRDLGGDGVRRGMLYRAEGLAGPADGGLAFIARRGIRTIIDVADAGRDPLHIAGVTCHHLRAAGSLDLDTEAVAETLAILTDPWAYPAVLHRPHDEPHASTVFAAVMGVLRLVDGEFATESLEMWRRYGGADGYAAAIGVGSAPRYVRAALLA